MPNNEWMTDSNYDLLVIKRLWDAFQDELPLNSSMGGRRIDLPLEIPNPQGRFWIKLALEAGDVVCLIVEAPDGSEIAAKHIGEGEGGPYDQVIYEVSRKLFKRTMQE